MKERSLLSIMASLVILGTGTIPAQAQRTTTNRPNSALVTAIRNAVGSNISNGFDRIEYFFTEVDLNNDGNKEVVVYTAGLHCGTSECPVYIFRRSGNSYLLIGRTGAISNGGQIALLPSRSNGWYDIATFVYNPQQRTANWKLHRFNGKSYQNTFQSLSSKPNQIILRPNRGSGISLADPGIASSQILAQVTQRLTSIRGINLDKVQYIPSENSRDAELNKAIIKWITSTGGNFTNEDFRRLSYYYNRVDLNGDGKPEVLVYLVGGSPSCGTGGCHTLIFKRVGTGYDLVSEIGLTRLPIIVTERRTNGWKDLIILTVGGGARANYWLVRFNGRTYPENPGSGSEIPSNSTVTGRAFMSETKGFSGIALQPQDSQIATGRSPNTGQQTTTQRSPNSSQSPPRTAARKLEASNLACTMNFRTILGQQAADYCTSADADSGILFERMTEPEIQTDGSIKINKMIIFNRGSADALIEVYGSRGNLVDLKRIDGNKPPTGLFQSLNPFDPNSIPASLFSKYPLSDRRRNLKEQEISNLTIPPDGTVKITKSSNMAVLYNAAMYAIEAYQLKQGAPKFAESETVREFVLDFAKDTFLARDSRTVINIFTSEPSAQGIFSLNLIDPKKSAEVLQKLLQYSVTIDGTDPSKNPFIGAFKGAFEDGANIGIEKLLDRLAPGLGTTARGVRLVGDELNHIARAVDLYYATASGEKATLTIRNIASTSP